MQMCLQVELWQRSVLTVITYCTDQGTNINSYSGPGMVSRVKILLLCSLACISLVLAVQGNNRPIGVTVLIQCTMLV